MEQHFNFMMTEKALAMQFTLWLRLVRGSTRKWVTRDDPGCGTGCGSQEFETHGERDWDWVAARTVPFSGFGTGTPDWVQESMYPSPIGQILGTISSHIQANYLMAQLKQGDTTFNVCKSSFLYKMGLNSMLCTPMGPIMGTSGDNFWVWDRDWDSIFLAGSGPG